LCLFSYDFHPDDIQTSPLAQQLANDMHEAISSDEIFHFRGTGPLLLVLDRMDDPVTPLLSQWTYQAMVHELMGLNNNRVSLKRAHNISKDLEEVVLSSSQDKFFRANRHANFGELGESIKHLLDDFQQQTQSAKRENLNSIEDMQQFMDKFPQIRSQSHNVSKHVALMGELARLVDVCSLMDVSQFEQELACADDHGSHVRELLDKLGNSNIQTADKLRLGLLYALRYETTGNISMVKQRMTQGGVSPDQLALMDIMLRYAGSKVRGPGLYGAGYHEGLSKFTKSFMTSVQGVSNVYSQHNPVLMDTIQLLLKNKLKEATHPYVGRQSSPYAGVNGTNYKPQEIIIFMAGGTTFEEATKVAEFNKNVNSQSNPGGVRLLLAGSTIHNSTSFLEELKKL
jgi:vacuolar protein sorting-associated protein 45